MDRRAEIGRVVSALENLLRGEVDDCARAIRNSNLDRAKGDFRR